MKKNNDKTNIFLTYIFKIFNSILKFYITWILIRNLIDPINYGNYSYFLTLINYIVLFISLGINSALMNMLTTNNEDDNKELKGAGYILNLFTSFLLIVVVLISSIWVKELKVNFLLIMLTSGYVFIDFVKRVSVAEKKVSLIINSEFIISLIIAIVYTIFKFNYIKYLYVYFGVYVFISNLIIFKYIRVSFKNIKTNIKLIINKIKEYGFNIYIGRIASLGTYDMDKIILKIYGGVEFVGFYNLGLNLISPITIFCDSLMSIKYKDIAQKNSLSRKIIFANYLWLIITCVLFTTIGRFLFEYLFSSSYSVLTEYFTIFSILAFLKGSYIPINNFLAAKNKGNYLRNAAFILSVINIVLNFSLIPIFKLKGAIIATIIALVFNNITHYYYYYKTVNELKNDYKLSIN